MMDRAASAETVPDTEQVGVDPLRSKIRDRAEHIGERLIGEAPSQVFVDIDPRGRRDRLLQGPPHAGSESELEVDLETDACFQGCQWFRGGLVGPHRTHGDIAEQVRWHQFVASVR
jgi:hypothetical protein